jgi:cytoskeletal protein CcmA (bactofilin family)
MDWSPPADIAVNASVLLQLDPAPASLSGRRLYCGRSGQARSRGNNMFGGKKSDDRVETPDWTPAPATTPRETSGKTDIPADAKTQIGPGTTIRGEIAVAGDAIVHGTVEGNLSATGNVEVMKGGYVKADIHGKSVRVVGRVEGKIVSGDRVQLLSGAHVKGDIHSQSLKIDEGVFFQGACVMGDNPLATVVPKIVPIASDAAVKVARAA